MVLPRSERQPGLRMIEPKWISLETLPTPSLRFHILSSLRGVMQGRAGGLVLRGLRKSHFPTKASSCLNSCLHLSNRSPQDAFVLRAGKLTQETVGYSTTTTKCRTRP